MIRLASSADEAPLSKAAGRRNKLVKRNVASSSENMKNAKKKIHSFLG